MKHTLVILAVLLGCTAMSAQTQSALPWMRTGRDAASMGMADAGYLADENLAWSSFGSAAIVPLSEKTFSVSATYAMWKTEPAHRAAAGFSYNVRNRVGISVGVAFDPGKKYQVYDAAGAAKGWFTPYDLQANFGIGVKIVNGFSIGVNAKYARQALAQGASSNVFAADVMLACKVKGFRATAGVASLGTPVKSAAGEKFNLPSSAKLTFGYDDIIAGGLHLAAYADGDYYFFNNTWSVAGGAAIGYKDIVNVRGGYRYSGDNGKLGIPCVMPSYASVGLGCGFRGVSLNAAYIFASKVINNSFVVGLTYSF